MSEPVPDLSIVVPCFNEEGNLDELTGRLKGVLDLLRLRGEIVLVDDGSRDGTRGVIERLAREHPEVRGVFHQRNEGIVAGWKSGCAAARGRFVLTTDADLQYTPEDLPRLWREMQKGGAELVQGWRIAHNFKSTTRWLLSVCFSFFLNRLFGTRLRDIKSGFILYTREAYRESLEYQGPYRYFQHFVTINAVSKGLRIRQVPVIFEQRHAGRSFITSPLLFSLRSLGDLPRAFVEFRLRNRSVRAARALAARGGR
jgi:phenylacetate-CoA ligase